MTITEQGRAELQAGRRDEAEKLFARGCFLDGDGEAAGYLSMMYFDEKLTKRTEESLSVALLLWAVTEDERASSAHRLGVQYLSSDRPDVRKKGAALVRKAEAQNYPNACCVSGILYYQAGDYDRAAAAFAKYPKLMTDRKPLKMYAECLEKKNPPEYIKAAECYEKYADQFDDPDALLKASTLLYENGEEERGVKCLIRVPGEKTPEQYEMIGKYYLYMGTTDEELRLADEYLHYANQFGCVTDFDMGRLEAKLGHDRDAYTYYCSALEKGYGIGIVFAGLSLLVLKLRKTDPAIAAEWPEDKLVEVILNALNYDENTRRRLETDVSYGEILGILARAYYEGIYVSQDKLQSLEYAGKNPGDTVCKFYLGLGIMDGLTKLPPEDGLVMVHEAAVEGYPEAIYIMGGLHANNQEWNKALDLYIQAYNAGFKKAAEQIAYLYEEGYVGTILGMANKVKAREWRKKAAES